MRDLTIAQLRDRLLCQVSPQIRAKAPTEQFSPISGSESFYRVSVPLSDEQFPLRLKYRRYDGGVRMGRCLEDLDTIAGIASYLHNGAMGRGLFLSDHLCKSPKIERC